MAHGAAATRVERLCESCRRPFLVEDWYAKKPGAGRFCSRQCAGAVRLGRALGTRRAEVVDLYAVGHSCGEIAVRLGVGLSAIARHLRAAGVPRRGAPGVARAAREERRCEQCGTTFVVRPTIAREKAKRFCSVACARAPKRTVEERLRAGVDTSSADGCWPWTGSIGSTGYGQMSRGKAGQPPLKTHRIAWESVAGPVPPGFEVCHTCDNRPCCRNDDVGVYEIGGVLRPRRGHLWLGTRKENLADAVAKGRNDMTANARKNARTLGHERLSVIGRKGAAGRWSHAE